MRRGFWAGLSVLIGLAILFSTPSAGSGADWGNPQLDAYAQTPIRSGTNVTLTGSGFQSGELLTGFGAIYQIHNEGNMYRGFDLPDLEVQVNAFGGFSVSVPLDVLPGLQGHVELALYYQREMITSEFLPVRNPGVYRDLGLDATAGTLYFDSFGHGGIGEPPVENDDDVPLTSSSAADWDGELFQVNLERYTTSNGTGTSTPVNNITNDVTFTGTPPYLDINPGSSGIVSGLNVTYQSMRMTVLVWDEGSYPTITGTTTQGSTQGQGWLSTSDATAPQVSSAQAISLTQIVVTFSENVTTPAIEDSATNNWTVTFNGDKAVTGLSPLGSSGTATCTLAVADLGDYGATPTVQFSITSSDEFEDAWGNDCAATTSPHITASDGIAPPAPTLDDPTSTTFLTGSSMTWAATVGAGLDNSFAGIKLQGSDNGVDWGDLQDDTSAPYGGTYGFGTKYSYYRALAYDNNANSTGSAATANLQDAFFLDLTTIPASVQINTESGQWEVTVKDNYGNTEAVTQTVGLSTESDGGRFRATSGGPAVGSIDLINSSTGNFYYIDSDVGTWEIKVTNVNYQPDSTDYQITAGSANRLHVKLPGQAFTSGTGVTGTPDFSGYSGDLRWSLAGTGFPVVLYITDAGNNLVYETGTRNIDFTTTAGAAPDGTNPTLMAFGFPVTNLSVDFLNGESTTTLTMICYDFTQNYVNQTLTASDNSGSPNLVGIVSSGFWTLFDTAEHVGWTGSNGAPTTTPVNAAQTAGVALPTLYIGAMDAYDNVDTTYTGSTITTTGGSSTPPTNSPSGTGQGGANAPNGNSPPDYGTNTTWNKGVMTLLNSNNDQRTRVFAATAAGFRIRAVASGGTLAGQYTANSDQFLINESTANYLRIEDTSGGGGTEYLDGETFNTGQSVTFWSIAYDTYGNTVGNYVASWSSTVLSPPASGNSTNWIFNPDTPVTNGTLTVSNGAVTDRTIVNITVMADPTVEYIILRTASGGGGEEAGAIEVAGRDNGSNENITDTLWVAGYNSDDLYIGDMIASWIMRDVTGGSFENGGAVAYNRYIASSTSNQAGYIYVNHYGYTDSSGLFTVDATKPATPQGFNIYENHDDSLYVNSSWDPTSSYDDGSIFASGNVDYFEVRFASAMINNEIKWNNATPVNEAGKPSSFNGSNAWQIYMGDAPPGYYYYAIKTRDDQGYWSGIASGCFTTAPDYSLPVTLSVFQARGSYGKIYVDWSTESEVDALGFNLLRDTSEEFENPLVVASYENYPELLCQGTSAAGFDYTFTDQEQIEPEVTYYYKLEAVDINGRSEKSEMNASAAALPLPTDYALGPNFPNPFNPVTHFDLKLPENSKVTVIVYDAMGREVTRILDNERMEAGIHQLNWNGTNTQGMPMPSGIYFTRMQADNAQCIMKMLLLK